LPPPPRSGNRRGEEFNREAILASGLKGPISESTSGPDVVEVSEVIVDRYVIQDSTQPAQGDPHTVGPAEAPKLPAAFDVRLQIEEHAGNPSAT
jgi:hypothetical protein